MKRGDFVTVAVQGDYGKSRPALVIQTDLFKDHASVAVLPVTSKIIDAPILRITVPSTAETGLQKTSQVMVDKIVTIKRSKVGPSFGHLETSVLAEVERSLAVFLGLAK